MRKIIFFFAVLCLLGMTSAAFTANILQNPGFETQDYEIGLPQAPIPWIPYGNPSICQNQQVVVHSESWAEAVTVSYTVPNTWWGLRQRLPVDQTGTKSYVLSAWIKKTADLEVKIYWEARGPNDEYLYEGEGETDTSVAGDWIQIYGNELDEETNPIPLHFGPEVAEVQYIVMVNMDTTLTGTVYVDDCGMTDVPSGLIRTAIHGTVTCQGAPVADAIVGIKPSAKATADAVMYAVSDVDGYYETETADIPAGDCYVAAWRAGMTPTADTVITLSGTDEEVNLQMVTFAGTNIVEGATAFIVSDQDDWDGMWGDKALDGNVGTYWATHWDNINPDYLLVDLDPVGATNMPISDITIWWADGMPLQYQIQTMVGGDPLTTDWDNPPVGVTVATIYDSSSTGTNAYEVPGMDITWVNSIRTDGASARGLRLLMPPGWVTWIPSDTVRELQVHTTDTVNAGVIDGTVTYSGMPISNAIVGIKTTTHATADAEIYTETDGDGNYGPILVPSGTIYVAAWAPGWTPTGDVEVNTTGGAQTANPVFLKTEGNNLSRSEEGRTVTIMATSELPGDEAGAAWCACDSKAVWDIGVDAYWNMVTMWRNLDEDTAPVFTLNLDTYVDNTYPVGAVTIYWADAPAKSYEIQVTTGEPFDLPGTWTTVYSTTNGAGHPTPIDFFPFGVYDAHSDFADAVKLTESVPARGVRLVITEFQPGMTYCGIHDIRVHSSVDFENLIIGKVTDESGDPIEGALVHYGNADMVWDEWSQESTDAGGFYTFCVVDPGQPLPSGYNFLTADAWQYANVDTIINLPGDGSPVVQNFVLPAKAETSLVPNWNAENVDTGTNTPVDWLPFGETAENVWESSMDYNHTPEGGYCGKHAYTPVDWVWYMAAGWKTPMIPIDGAKSYNLWFHSPVDTRDCAMKVEFLDSAGNWVGDKAVDWLWNIATERTARRFILYRATPPEGAAYMVAYWGKESWGGTTLFDDIILEEVEAPLPPTIADLKDTEKYPDGSVINISGKRLTALVGNGAPADQGPGGFADKTGYIEEPDRSSGIRIDITNALGSGDAGMSGPGDEVAVLGIVKTLGTGERYIEIGNMVNWAWPRPLDALGMNMRFANSNLAQGLFVKLTGKVTAVGTDNFRITDGSVDESGAPIETTVYCGTVNKPAVEDMVKVRGIVSTDGTKATLLMRNEQVDVVDASDLQPLPFQGGNKALRDYLVIGPFGNPVDENGDSVFDELDMNIQLDTDYIGEATVTPSIGDAVGENVWCRPDIWFAGIDLNNDNGEYSNCVLYGHAYVYSPIAQDVDIPVGYDEFIKVYVNGTLVFMDNDEHRGAWFGQNCIYGVHLNAGINSVLIKLSQSGGGYGWVTQFAVPGTYTGEDWTNSTPIQGLGYLLNYNNP